MATTTTRSGRTVEVKAFDAAWDWASVMGGKCSLESVHYEPSGADTVVVRDGGTDGPILFQAVTSNTSEQNVRYYDGQWCVPYVDYADCVFVNSANARLVFTVR